MVWTALYTILSRNARGKFFLPKIFPAAVPMQKKYAELSMPPFLAFSSALRYNSPIDRVCVRTAAVLNGALPEADRTLWIGEDSNDKYIEL